jgi:uncharacterized membrane protein required for colicin V production
MPHLARLISRTTQSNKTKSERRLGPIPAIRFILWLCTTTSANPAIGSTTQTFTEATQHNTTLHALFQTMLMNLHHINVLDWGVLSLLLAGAIIGCYRGFLQDIFGAAVLSLAGLFALWNAHHGLYLYLKPYIASSTPRLCLNIFFSMFLVWLCALPLKKWSHKSISDSTLSGINRSLGFALGTLKGFAILVLICMLTQITHPEMIDKTTHSILLPQTYRLAKRIIDTPMIKNIMTSNQVNTQGTIT